MSTYRPLWRICKARRLDRALIQRSKKSWPSEIAWSKSGEGFASRELSIIDGRQALTHRGPNIPQTFPPPFVCCEYRPRRIHRGGRRRFIARKKLVVMGSHRLVDSRDSRQRCENHSDRASCQSIEWRKRGADGADYIFFFGPVFFNAVPIAMYGEPQGLRCLAEAVRLVAMPVLAIGGIAENANRCLQAGATGLAAILLFQYSPIPSLRFRRLHPSQRIDSPPPIT